jgi:hypothetical protein
MVKSSILCEIISLNIGVRCAKNDLTSNIKITTCLILLELISVEAVAATRAYMKDKTEAEYFISNR